VERKRRCKELAQRLPGAGAALATVAIPGLIGRAGCDTVRPETNNGRGSFILLRRGISLEAIAAADKEQVLSRPLPGR